MLKDLNTYRKIYTNLVQIYLHFGSIYKLSSDMNKLDVIAKIT